MVENRGKSGFLILLIIITGVFLSATLYFNDVGTLDISHIDASATFFQDGTGLLVQPVLRNTRGSDSGSIILEITVEDQRNRQVLGEGNSSIGYVKAKHNQTANIFIPMSGEVTGRYYVEIRLIEEGEFLATRSAYIDIAEPSVVTEESDLKFGGLDLFINKISKVDARVLLTPSIKNDGGNSGVVTLNLELKDVNSGLLIQKGGANLGVVKGGEAASFKFDYDVPDNKSYNAIIEVFEDGKSLIIGRVTEPINLSELPKEKLLQLYIIEDKRPPEPLSPYVKSNTDVEYTPPEFESQTPGFETILAVLGILAASFARRRR